MKTKKAPPKQPAPTVAKHDSVRDLEKGNRGLFHIQKVFLAGGDVSAAVATTLESGMPDPSDGSLTASVSVIAVDAQLDSWGDYRQSQQTKARKERSAPINALMKKLLAPRYADYTNAELWDVLLSFSDSQKVRIVEELPRARLSWEDDQTCKRGTLSYEAFENRLANLRRASGTLKRGRKSS